MGTRMFRKGLAVAVILLFMGMSVVPTTGTITKEPYKPLLSGNTLYVGGSGPNNYSSIQSAIDNASTDDTVFVYDDSSPYYEHVKINKRINLIGEDKNNTVIDGNFSGGAIVKINAGGVFISGFTIQNSGHHPPSLVGIGVSIASDGNHIVGNIIRNNWDGISLSHSNNIIEENSIIHNTYGVDIFDWDKCYFNNVITGNFIAHNSRSGICDDDRDVGTIATWNVIADNGKLVLHYSSQGVFKHDSYSVYHHNDFFFNSVNAVVNGGRYGNDWDDGSEGNFWDDWEDNTGYPNVYIIPSSLSEEIDHHPSVTPYSNSLVVGLSGHYYALIDEPIEFSADITVDPYSVSWYWEFGNGDTSNEVFPTYSYGSSGLYHINATVTDSQGRSDTSKAEAHIGLAPYTPTINGPRIGKPGVVYNYTIVSVDPDGDDIYYLFDWGDGTNSDWQGPYASGAIVDASHMWTEIGDYEIRAKAHDGRRESNWSEDLIITIGNGPPDAPTITGETNGEAGTSYPYTFTSIDPDGDDVKYYIDWGDGSTDETVFSTSGTPVTVSHTWVEKDTYIITAKAQDEHGLEGPEGTLEISMPKSRAFNINYPMLSWLFERFPNAFPILRHLMGL